MGVIYQKDSDGNPVTSTIEFIHWTGISSLNLTLSDTGDRGITGSASGAQSHSSGDTFEVWVHSSYYILNAVTKTAVQTLTNKTLTSPVISSISNTGTITLPTASDTLVGRATTDTLTNKRITKRVTSITSSATPTINTDNCDVVDITALAEAITSMTTGLSGTPTNFQTLIIRFKDNGTARAITWGASFASRGATLPTTTTAGKYTHVGLMYNTTTSTWDCIAAIVEA